MGEAVIYKLTDASMRTYNGYQWRLNEWRETGGTGGLCGSGWPNCQGTL